MIFNDQQLQTGWLLLYGTMDRADWAAEILHQPTKTYRFWLCSRWCAQSRNKHRACGKTMIRSNPHIACRQPSILAYLIGLYMNDECQKAMAWLLLQGRPILTTVHATYMAFWSWKETKRKGKYRKEGGWSYVSFCSCICNRNNTYKGCPDSFEALILLCCLHTYSNNTLWNK